MSETRDYSQLLTTAFERVLNDKYQSCMAPPPYLTPFGIKHLDALLGGGFSSSLPVCLSSTPETGKSTIAFQFAAAFQKHHKNSVVVYLDTETASSPIDEEYVLENRLDTFEIDRQKFIYKPVVVNVKEVVNLIEDLIDLKNKFEARVNEEIHVLFIWDSMASTPSTKDSTAEDPDKTIGYKARELTFYLNKIKPKLAINKITTIFIDQVRSNLKIDGPYVRSEKSVGDFGNYKSATSISALQHNIKQWLFLSKGKELKRSDSFGVDGWELNIYTEKNKIVPSNYWITVIFDKKYGIIPLLSEYLFLRDMTKSERKMYNDNESKLPCPLCIKTVSNSRVLEVCDPSTGSILYTSDKFRESKFIDLYNSNSEFQSWFDKAMDISVDYRIVRGLFRGANIDHEDVSDESEEE
jgi:RecA/RadA recombinase